MEYGDKAMLDKDEVRTTIRSLIERKERRITGLQRENRDELSADKRLHNDITITNMQHSIDTLLELEHVLRLCGCPEEAYVVKQEG